VPPYVVDTNLAIAATHLTSAADGLQLLYQVETFTFCNPGRRAADRP
jgi:hypothetical protein